MKIFRNFFFVVVVISSFVLGALFFVARSKVIDFSALEYYNPGSPSLLLDDAGNEWARFELDKREPVAYEDMPKHVINAFVATEDWSFFKHVGISVKGIIRSVLVNIYHGRRVQGASTITQQLVRLLFFNASKTFVRKIKEQVVAVLVERQFTKEQIMQTYLNHVCFGCGIYGVQAACQRFWGKTVQEITIDQAAALAGIMKSPRNYCPLTYPLSCQKRRNIVLGLMKKLQFITPQEYGLSRTAPLTIVSRGKNRFAPHIKEWIRQFLEDKFGKSILYTGGLKIKTTLSKKIQTIAEDQFSKQYEPLKKSIAHDVDGALISVDVSSGEIKALVGGFDFARSQWNRALQARRQMGSVFKPILYTAAVQSGINFAHTEVDEPIEVKQGRSIWSPKNFNHQFNGKMTIAHALATSCNTIAAKTFLSIGAKPVVALAKKFKLRGPFHPYPSLALGCIDVSLKEVAGMFNVFANNGVYVEPHCISWVKNKWGTKIWKVQSQQERVISAQESGQVATVLQIGLHRVRKWFPQKWVDAQAISKTGTTNDSRTCWFVGSTPTLTTAVYIGCDDNRSMGKNVYPLRTAFPIWIGVNRELEFSQKKFSFDPTLQEVCVNKFTGKLTLKATDKDAISIMV
ncbi:transglycosylase domain-containing protein [bacterium]|nr:transglycosylase domain-containing protein [bacterium]